MSGFLKMACVLLAVSAAVFAQEKANAQSVNLNVQPQANPQIHSQIERYDRMRSVGNRLIISGAITGTVSTILSAVVAPEPELQFFTVLEYRNHWTGEIWWTHNGERYDSFAEAKAAMDRSKREAQREYDERNRGAIIASNTFFVIGAISYSAMIAGIPIRIVGRKKGNNLRNALPNSAYVVPNGINFAWNF